MHFEGSEKKIEIISQAAAFRSRPESYWNKVVNLADARILSKVSSDACDAYLLSESSLFVWDDRVTMITCGRTTLIKAAMFLIGDLKGIDFLWYQRKNEYFPGQQATDFQNDVELLRTKTTGTVLGFGSKEDHHLNLYHLDKPFQPTGMDCTLEVLMYGLQGVAKEIFNCNQTLDRVRQLTKLEAIFPGFQLDDHLFEPCGYSLNAIKGGEYYTIHVTPEDPVSYVSFETNVHLCARMSETLRQVVEVFQPSSFDVVHFHPDKGIRNLDMAPFKLKQEVRRDLDCGFEVAFSTYEVRA